MRLRPSAGPVTADTSCEKLCLLRGCEALFAASYDSGHEPGWIVYPVEHS